MAASNFDPVFWILCLIVFFSLKKEPLKAIALSFLLALVCGLLTMGAVKYRIYTEAAHVVLYFLYAAVILGSCFGLKKIFNTSKKLINLFMAQTGRTNRDSQVKEFK